MTVAHTVAAASSGPTLADAVDGIRMILHVLAATIWVGGQFTMAGLLPTIRTLGDDASQKLARALGRLLWPAYAVLVLTGVWNISAVGTSTATTAWRTVLIIKVVTVALAGVAVALHQRSTSKAALAAWGAIGALASVAALCFGVFLAG